MGKTFHSTTADELHIFPHEFLFWFQNSALVESFREVAGSGETKKPLCDALILASIALVVPRPR